MKHRVKRVFEWDLDAMLDEIDQKGGELVRILDLPKEGLAHTDCSRCRKVGTGKLCEAHATAASCMPRLKRPEEEIYIILPRYAVVYKERD
jgi:hypothetical protein